MHYTGIKKFFLPYIKHFCFLFYVYGFLQCQSFLSFKIQSVHNFSWDLWNKVFDIKMSFVIPMIIKNKVAKKIIRAFEKEILFKDY